MQRSAPGWKAHVMKPVVARNITLLRRANVLPCTLHHCRPAFRKKPLLSNKR